MEALSECMLMLPCPGLADMTGDRERKGKAEGDGVKNVYKEIQSSVPALNDTTAPILMEYLATG